MSRAGSARGWGAAAALAAVLACDRAAAQHITIDGSLSPAQTLAGPNYTIGANLGKQIGGNLFQSFGIFGLSTGESANFIGPATVGNIIGRITGGSQSSIDGRLKSSIAGANLYLINPAGIVFGPNATVNVTGSFRAATADYLKTADGARFQATNPSGSTLSAAAPAAFGFLNAAPPAITANGSVLTVPQGQTLGLAGGAVNVTGATLQAPAGMIHLTGIASTGEIPLAPKSGSSTVTNHGPVNITQGSLVDVGDPTNLGSGGSIYVRAGNLTVDNSEINADNFGAGGGGALLLRGDSSVTLSGGTNVHAAALAGGSGGAITLMTGIHGAVSADNSTVTVGSGGSGNAGPLSVTTGQLSLTNGGALTSYSLQSGSGGPIAITAASVRLDGGAAMNQSTGVSSTTTGVAGGGSITLNAGQLALHNGAGVLAESFGAGAGGGVAVSTGGPLTIDSGASLGTFTTAAGNAGNVSVGVTGPITIDMSVGAATSTLDGIGSFTAGAGNAGNVSVTAAALTLTNYGQVASTTFSSGNAGNMSVIISGMLTILGPTGAQDDTGIAAESEDGSNGNSGNVNVSAGSILIGSSGGPVIGFVPPSFGGFVDTEDNLTGISAQAEGFGLHAGIVTVASAGALTIGDGGLITAQTFGPSAGGVAQVTAQGPLTLSGPGSGIVASAVLRASGKAGSVTVTAPQITVATGAEIASTTAGTGAGGAVNVTTPGALLLDGMGIGGTQIAASATGPYSGAGGDVTVTAGSVTAEGGAQIASSTAGPGSGGNINLAVGGNILLSGAGPQITAGSSATGNAGSITVAAANLTLQDGAGISTQAAAANGGDIALQVGDFLHLTNSSITTSVLGANGNGGNILIDSSLVVLDSSSIIAQAVAGHGGNITISAGDFIATPDSIVSASSQLGISGAIELIGPRVDLNGSLVVLPGELRNSAQVSRTSCEAHGGPRSSLVDKGRGGLPQDTETTIPALYLVDRDIVRVPDAGALQGGQLLLPRPMPQAAHLTMGCG